MATVDVSRYVDLPYSLEVRLEIDGDGDRFYTAFHHELLGCRAQGDSPEEALASLREARQMYLAAFVEAGLEVPRPIILRPLGRIPPSFSIEDRPVRTDEDTQVQPLPAKVAVHSYPEARATAPNAVGEHTFPFLLGC